MKSLLLVLYLRTLPWGSSLNFYVQTATLLSIPSTRFPRIIHCEVIPVTSTISAKGYALGRIPCDAKTTFLFMLKGPAWHFVYWQGSGIPITKGAYHI